MADIQPVQISDTFQVWLNRTNEVISTINDSALLSSAGTPTPRIGNVSLQGTFTANTILGTSATITSITTTALVRESNPELILDVNSPFRINGPGLQENLLEVKANTGARPVVGLTNGTNRKWEVALETSEDGSPFIIRTGIGANPQLRLTQAGRIVATSFQGDGSLITNIDPDNIGSGIIPIGNVPDLDASKITSGTFFVERIPNLDANKITSGTLNVARIPNLDANKIASGTLNAGRLPSVVVRTDSNQTIEGSMTLSGTNRSLFINNNPSAGNGIRIHHNNTLAVMDYTGNMLFRDGVGTTTNLTIFANGNLTARGDITAFSDERIKNNIEVIENATSKVLQIRGVTFTRTDQVSGNRYAGVIAQEVEKVLPEVVDTNEDGIKTVAYGNMVGLLIQAIKELNVRVDELQSSLKD